MTLPELLVWVLTLYFASFLKPRDLLLCLGSPLTRSTFPANDYLAALYRLPHLHASDDSFQSPVLPTEALTRSRTLLGQPFDYSPLDLGRFTLWSRAAYQTNRRLSSSLLLPPASPVNLIPASQPQSATSSTRRLFVAALAYLSRLSTIESTTTTDSLCCGSVYEPPRDRQQSTTTFPRVHCRDCAIGAAQHHRCCATQTGYLRPPVVTHSSFSVHHHPQIMSCEVSSHPILPL